MVVHTLMEEVKKEDQQNFIIESNVLQFSFLEKNLEHS